MRDHARGCEGRNYSCTCGYDDAVTARIEALEAALRTLVNEHEVLGFVGGPSAEAWDAARAALGEKQ